MSKLPMWIRQYTTSAIAHIQGHIQRRVAQVWQYIYRVEFTLGRWLRRYREFLGLAAVLLLISASVYVMPVLQVTLAARYTTEAEITQLQGLILNVGSALIGAAAIVTSLVLFAMQVNIERMPHGLFRSLSTDRKLLGAFTATFLLAIGLATLSAIVYRDTLALAALTFAWATMLILGLFIYAYRRALVLINPLRQLRILSDDTCSGIRRWARRAQRAVPLITAEGHPEGSALLSNSQYDLARTTYFKINHHWTDGAHRGVRHAVSVARSYAERGDYEVSGAALQAIASINVAYIEAKGNTFYTNHLFFENPLATDTFINDTLECLRQHCQSGIARRDEQHIEQTLQTIAALVQAYIYIDYSSPDARNYHAHLAAEYLSSALESVVPHDMADVLLEGQRLMARCARLCLGRATANEIVTLSEKIALIARTGCTKENYQPVTMAGVQHLTDLILGLLRSKDQNIDYALARVRQDMNSIAKLSLAVPNTSLLSIHNKSLESYYSGLSTTGFTTRFMELVNEIVIAQEDDIAAQNIVRNIERWAYGCAHSEKEILLTAIRVGSHFTCDMIHWIGDMTKGLLALSNARACDFRTKSELQKHASALMATLTWVPHDKESVRLVENYRLTEVLFETGMDARDRGCTEIAREIADILLSWAFNAGKSSVGSQAFEDGLSGYVVLLFDAKDFGSRKLLTEIDRRIRDDSKLDDDLLRNTATRLRARVRRIPRNGYSLSMIDRAMSMGDHQGRTEAFDEVADMLTSTIP